MPTHIPVRITTAFLVAALLLTGLTLPAFAEAAEGTRYIVKYKNETNAKRISMPGTLSVLGNTTALTKQGIQVVSVAPGEKSSDVLRTIKNNSAVEYVEVDKLIPFDSIPSDPDFAGEWHHAKINTPRAWDLTTGAGVKVAVLDTGANCNMPELIGRCEVGWDTMSNTIVTDDDHGHGTWVATTLAANANNGVNGVGAAYGVTVVPVKINEPGTGSAYLSEMAEAITWAADHGIRIVTMSSSGLWFSSPTLQSAANYLNTKNGQFFMSAGNDAKANVTGSNPASIMSVTASSETDEKPTFTNTGAYIDLAAPGTNVLMTGSDGLSITKSGTSFSAPQAASVAAMVLARNPALTPAQLREVLLSTADDVGAAGTDTTFGRGRLNAGRAVAAAFPDIIVPTAPATLTATTAQNGDRLLSWSAATDNVDVKSYQVFRNNVQIATVLTTSYVDTTAPETVVQNSVISYKVRAVDYAGKVSAYSPSVTVSVQLTGPDTVAPTTPPKPTATISGTQVTVNWVASTDAYGLAGYRVFRNGTELATATPATLKYIDKMVLPATQYSYAVQAYDTSDNASPLSPLLAVTAGPTDTTVPTTPAGYAGTSTPLSATLTWNASVDNVGIAGYQIFRNSVLYATTSATTFVDTAVTQNTTYKYSVKAYDAQGLLSPATATISLLVPFMPDSVPPSIPLAVQAAPTQGGILVSWLPSTDNVGVKNYRVLRNNVLMPAVTTTTYLDTAAVPGTVYTYKIRAYDIKGNYSAYSAAAVITAP